MKCYLDIDIGDSALHAKGTENFEFAQLWLAQNASIYGLSDNIDELSEDQIELARESFTSDPAWSSKTSEPL